MHSTGKMFTTAALMAALLGMSSIVTITDAAVAPRTGMSCTACGSTLVRCLRTRRQYRYPRSL